VDVGTSGAAMAGALPEAAACPAVGAPPWGDEFITPKQSQVVQKGMGEGRSMTPISDVLRDLVWWSSTMWQVNDTESAICLSGSFLSGRRPIPIRALADINTATRRRTNIDFLMTLIA
jgi:hypothetical protein